MNDDAQRPDEELPASLPDIAVDAAPVEVDQIPAEQLAPEVAVAVEQEEEEPPSRWVVALRSVATGSFGISVLAIVIALVIGGILISLTNPAVQAAAGYFFSKPGDTFAAIGNAVGGAYSTIFNSSIYNFSSPSFELGIQSLTGTLSVSTPLIAAGLGIALGFRVGMFNIGGQGQILIAALCAGVVGFALPLPPGIHLIVALIAGLIGGGIWAAIAGVLKAFTGAHEVIVTIMINYIAIYLLNYFLTLPFFRAKGSSVPRTPAMDESAKYPPLFGAAYGVDLGFIFVIVATVVVWWLLERSSLGFKFRAVGENPSAARTAGINVKSVSIWAMTISGVLVGLAGVSQVLGTTLQGGFDSTIDAGIGFTGITVALLGRSRPLGVFVAGLLLGALQQSASYIQAIGVSPDLITVIQSVIVLFIAAPPLIRAIFRLPTPGAPKKQRKREKPGKNTSEVTV